MHNKITQHSVVNNEAKGLHEISQTADGSITGGSSREIQADLKRKSTVGDREFETGHKPHSLHSLLFQTTNIDECKMNGFEATE